MTSASWTVYRVVLAADSPIHIGWHGLGLIRRTRYYLPARALWGILVAGLAQRLAVGEPDTEIYRKAEEKTDLNLRVTPFFALPKSLRDDETLRPKYSEEGLKYGGWTASEFEYSFLSSYTSTALNAETLGHEEGALHESETLNPKGRDADETPLRFVGYLLIGNGLETEAVMDTLRMCWIGGDRRYGWGCLKMQGEVSKWTEKLFGEYEVDGLDSETPIVRPSGPNCTLPAHAICDSGLDPSLEGELEVVVGRNWSDKGSGQRISGAKICWVPGSRFRANAGTSLRFQITEKGFWKLATRPT